MLWIKRNGTEEVEGREVQERGRFPSVRRTFCAPASHHSAVYPKIGLLKFHFSSEGRLQTISSC